MPFGQTIKVFIAWSSSYSFPTKFVSCHQVSQFISHYKKLNKIFTTYIMNYTDLKKKEKEKQQYKMYHLFVLYILHGSHKMAYTMHSSDILLLYTM